MKLCFLALYGGTISTRMSKVFCDDQVPAWFKRFLYLLIAITQIAKKDRPRMSDCKKLMFVRI